MAVVFDDTFTEGSDTTLASHTPDTGTSWTDVSGTAATWEITAASDDVAADSDHTNVGLTYSADHSGTNIEYDIEIDVVVEGTGNSHPWGFNARYVDINNRYIVKVWNRGPLDVQFIKVVSGTGTSLGTADTDNVWTDERCKFEIRDAAKKFFFGATEELSTTDDALTSLGKPHLSIGAFASATDDIDATWAFDNFTVTEPAAAGVVGHGRLFSNERNRLVVNF